MKYLTADTHFGHRNIITYCNRPFKDIKDMEIGLINNFNSILTDKDELYIIGDVGFFKNSNHYTLEKIINQINGTKHLIIGNHDDFKPFTYLTCGFTRVHTSLELKSRYTYELVHDPSISQIDRRKIFLVGHVHDLFVVQKNCINVGVDVCGYKPISIEEIDLIVDKALENFLRFY